MCSRCGPAPAGRRTPPRREGGGSALALPAAPRRARGPSALSRRCQLPGVPGGGCQAGPRPAGPAGVAGPGPRGATQRRRGRAAAPLPARRLRRSPCPEQRPPVCQLPGTGRAPPLPSAPRGGGGARPLRGVCRGSGSRRQPWGGRGQPRAASRARPCPAGDGLVPGARSARGLCSGGAGGGAVCVGGTAAPPSPAPGPPGGAARSRRTPPGQGGSSRVTARGRWGTRPGAQPPAPFPLSQARRSAAAPCPPGRGSVTFSCPVGAPVPPRSAAEKRRGVGWTGGGLGYSLS